MTYSWAEVDRKLLVTDLEALSGFEMRGSQRETKDKGQFCCKQARLLIPRVHKCSCLQFCFVCDTVSSEGQKPLFVFMALYSLT